MAASKNKPYIFFFFAILLISVFMFVIQWQRRLVPRLSVPTNKGIASLFTIKGRLTAVFQDGKTCVWDWNALDIKQADFMAGSGRAIPLADGNLGVISRLADRRLLSIYDLDAGRKIKDLTVGLDEQDIHLRNSRDMTVPTLIRRNVEKEGTVEYEFAAVNLAAELIRPSILLKIDLKTQTLRDFVVSDGGILFAAGADEKRARLAAIDLNTGQTLWDQTWPHVEELTSLAVSLDGQTVWAGDRAGNLLFVAAGDGQLRSKVSLLKPGETRPVTNDFSVLNLDCSPDGRRLGCAIAPIAYAIDAATGSVTHRFSGHKVVSKVAFSPDSRKLATSDIRADGAILIRNLD